MNILWLTVDSMRSYSGNSDDRGRISFFDEFCQDAIEFTNCYCSAPSTVMSVSSMMTSVPAVYHSTAYDHFDKNSFGFETFPKWLMKNGFTTKAIVFFPEGREHLSHLMGDTLKRFWPQKKKNLFWNNKDIYDVYSAALSECSSNENNFLYVHFNIRHDPTTNKWVKKCYREFERKFKNPLVVLTSDHGYPDPDRGIKQKEMIYHGHDLIMTDDNVRVPLAIKGLPGISGFKTDTRLASLIDVVPTLQRIIDPQIKTTLNGSFFDSGVDLLSETRKSLQIYNRYIFQKNQQIKFVFEDKKIIYSNNIFTSEVGSNVEHYNPTQKEVKFVDDHIEKIFGHFYIFLEKKLQKLEQEAFVFTTNAPPNIKSILNNRNSKNIKVTDNLSDISSSSKVYVLKSSENVFSTINDLNSVNKVLDKRNKPKVVSLNLDFITIPRNKFLAVLTLVRKKLMPRLISNPMHTIKELIIVFKKVI